MYMQYDPLTGEWIDLDDPWSSDPPTPPPPDPPQPDPNEVIYRPGSDPPQWYDEQQQVPESGGGGVTPPDIYRDWPGSGGGQSYDDPYGPGGAYYGGGGYGPPPQRSPFMGQLNYPMFTAQQFQAPAPFSYDPFSYESFSAPTIEQAQKEPGFDYALQQGLKALENSRAYQGTYRSGATIKGLNDYARNMANQNYDRVYERSADTYDRNRGNAFGTWSANRENAANAYTTNYGISRDVFDRQYQGARDEYAPRAREAELNFGHQWDQYVYENDDAFRRWNAMLQANSGY